MCYDLKSLKIQKHRTLTAFQKFETNLKSPYILTLSTVKNIYACHIEPHDNYTFKKPWSKYRVSRVSFVHL